MDNINQIRSNESLKPAVNYQSLKAESKKLGRELVKSFQKQVGAGADGYFGPNTFKAYQNHLEKKGLKLKSIKEFMESLNKSEVIPSNYTLNTSKGQGTQLNSIADRSKLISDLSLEKNVRFTDSQIISQGKRMSSEDVKSIQKLVYGPNATKRQVDGKFGKGTLGKYKKANPDWAKQTLSQYLSSQKEQKKPIEKRLIRKGKEKIKLYDYKEPLKSDRQEEESKTKKVESKLPDFDKMNQDLSITGETKAERYERWKRESKDKMEKSNNPIGIIKDIFGSIDRRSFDFMSNFSLFGGLKFMEETKDTINTALNVVSRGKIKPFEKNENFNKEAEIITLKGCMFCGLDKTFLTKMGISVPDNISGDLTDIQKAQFLGLIVGGTFSIGGKSKKLDALLKRKGLFLNRFLSKVSDPFIKSKVTTLLRYV